MLDLLNKISENNILIEVNEGKLRLSSSNPNIDANLLDEIKLNKENLISYLSNSSTISTTESNQSIKQYATDVNYPLSSLQYRLWLISQQEVTGSEAYNMPFSTVVEIEDIQIFEKAIHQVIDRHEILRTVFKEDEQGNIKQWVKNREALDFKITYKDFRNEIEKDATVEQYIEEDSYKLFDLENGPLIRITIIQIAKDEYVFYYNMHHIICDAWSMGILSRDIIAFYHALLDGEDVKLPELPIQYKDYACWQAEELNSDTAKSHEAYWAERLKGDLPILDLPANKIRPKVFSYQGNCLATYIEPTLVKDFKKYCKDHKGSLFMGLLSVWNILFYKYTGQNDIIIGSPVSGRDLPELKDQIGIYINTLPLRTQIHPEQSFHDLFQQVKEDTLTAYEHQSYPFDKVVESLALKGDRSRNAVYDILFTLQNSDGSTIETEIEDYTIITEEGYCLTKLDLEIDFEEVGDDIFFQILYNVDVYDREMIERLMVHFQVLLQAIVHTPEEKIYVLNYLTANEQIELQVDFNNTDVTYDTKDTYISLFKKYVKSTPDKLATIGAEASYTYKELDEVSNKLAQHIKEIYNVDKGDTIIINVERGEWVLISILTIFKLGCAYIPVDPTYPEERKNYILNDSDTTNIINAEVIADFKKKTATFTTDFEAVTNEMDDLAYIIYTSGSTGKPKGVMIPHEGMLNHMYAMVDELEMNQNTVIVQNAPYTFDISVWQFLNVLIVGGTVSIFDQPTILDAEAFLNRIIKEKVTILQVVPSYLKELLAFDNRIKNKSLRNLSYLLVTGEAVHKELIHEWFLAYPEIKLVNAYGPAEASDDVTLHIMTEVPKGLNVSVGKPIQNIKIHILDAYFQLCGKGIIGEICVSGVGLAKGYLNRPELTDEKFVMHPTIEGLRLYKTGDLGRWSEDGTIEFMGRADDQVKIRGHRVELGEIKHFIEELPQIETSVVTVTKDQHGASELVAYFVAKETIDKDDIKKHLTAALPVFMVPNHYIELDKIPLTPNGKLDKKALPTIESLAVENTQSIEAPTNETEEKLIEMWKKVLKKDTISIKDDFFELGGHSLVMMRLLNNYHKSFDIKLKLKDLFENSTVEAQARLINSKNKTIFKPIAKVAEQESYVLSSSQYRLWVLSQFEGGSVAYNMPSISVIKIDDLDNFYKAIHQVIDRHEILRTVFKESFSGELRQLIKSREEFNFTVDYQDFRNIQNTKEAANNYIANDSFVPFDLETGPLIRMILIQISEDDFVFYYNMHHIISDGWSIDIVARDVLSFYEANKSNQKATLPELPIQYKDYTYWQVTELESEKYKAHKDFWLQKLSGELPVLELPTNNIRPKTFSYQGHCLNTFIAPEIANALKTYCTQQKGSLFMGLLASFNILFHKYSGQKDIIIGSPVSGRDHPDLKDQIGFYVNTLALRHTINPEDTFDTFFNTVKENVMASYDHQMYPFDKLVESLALKRDNSRSAVFDVLLTLQNQEKVEAIAMEASQYGQINDSGECRTKFDLEIDFQEVGDAIDFQIIYNTDIYEREMIENLMHHFQELLQSTFQQTTQQIKFLNYVPVAEQNKILIDFNDTYRDYSHKGSFIEMFKKQVAIQPEKLAIKAKNRSFTYHELDLLTNKLANHLKRTFKIQKNDHIVINIERNEWLAVVVVATYKLGCAYIPVDPSYPEERKQYILENSGCTTVVNADIISAFISKIEELSAEYTPEKITEDDLAYIIYTSGSTGKPKGVMLPHRGMVNHLHLMAEELKLDANSIIVQNAPYTFDISVWQLLNALIVGGTTNIYYQELILDTKKFLEQVQKDGVTILQVVPTYLKELLALEELLDCRYLENINYLSTTGEAISKELIVKWLQRYPNTPLVNAYGPAEASDDVSLKFFNEAPKTSYVSVGKPVQNLHLYILDKHMQLCGIGITGEICIAGAGLAKGYINNEQLTKEKFIPHPFKEGAFLYKTGDLGKWEKDGSIIYLGRKDFQVKIRGHRIELEEIEYQLSTKEEISTAVVTAIGDDNQKQLVAYFVAEKEVSPSNLRNYLLERMPAFMTPNHFVQLDEMPLNSNGKIDRKALPKFDGTFISDEVEYVSGTTAKEKILLEVCENVLNKQRVSLKDNFFNLGGDSIKSIQLVSRLRQKGYKLRVDEILQTPLLEELVEFISINTKEIDQSPVEGKAILTPIQQWLFDADEMKVASYYNQSVCLKSNTDINISILEQCIAALVKHHDALRMNFSKENNTWTQYNNGISGKHYTLQSYDLRAYEHPRVQMKQLSTALQSSIDIENGPLFKIGHFKLEDGDYLALIIHHLVIDGISWRILLEDLTVLYNQGRNKQTFALPLKTESFQQWGTVLTNYVKEEKFQQEKSYWKNVCEQEVTELPVDSVLEESRVLNGESFFTLSKEITSLLQSDIHATYNTEINDVLLTALGLALKETLGVDKSVLNMEGHGREELVEDIDITRTVGWFTSEFPFVLNVHKENSIGNLIHVKESLRNIPNKGIGYGMFKYLTPDFTADVKPSIEFNYLGDFGASIGAGDEETAIFEYVSEDIGANSDTNNGSIKKLDIAGMIVNGELELTFTYAQEEYNETTIEKLAKAYKKHLEDLVRQLATETNRYLTPSDVTFNKLSVEDIFEINKDFNVEDIYRLSPLQEGIYYHWLSDVSSSMYLEQMSYSLSGVALKKEDIEKAYNQLIDRHEILRTSFSETYGEELLQIVHKKVANNFTYEKVTQQLNTAEKIAYAEKIKEDDRANKFDLATPCQMRLQIIDFGDGSYEFLWSHHHILMDGWCMGIIVNEFTELFEAILQNRNPILSEVNPYSNYIKWLDSINENVSIDYWTSYLNAYYETASIPFKNKNANDDDAIDKATSELIISGETFKKIEKVCVDIGVTMNTFVQAAWSYLLARYNNTNDVVFGVVVSGRPPSLEGVESMLGLFINTIPVRMTYTTEDTPASILQNIHQKSIEGRPHHYLSLAEIQSKSNLGMNLLDHIMVFENFPVEELIQEDKENRQEEELSIDAIDMTEQINYDLDVTVGLSGTELIIDFTYDKAVYETSAIEAVNKHFENVIERFATQETETLTNFDFLSAAEKEELIITHNNYEESYPTNQTIVDVFTQRVLENPNEIAVVFEDTKLTFKELDVLSNQLAHYLIKNHNVTAGNLVGIKLERSEWVIVSLFAILKTGSAYIPIDISYPQDRIEFIEKDSQFEVCIDQAILEDFKQQQNTLSTEKLTRTIAPNDLAYIIYTSGSTGYPKGVLVAHESVVNIYYGWKTAYNLEDFKVTLLQLASFSFDMSVADLCRSILTGGTMVICGNDTKLDTMSMCDLITKNNVSVFEGTPSFVLPLMRHIHKEKINIASLKMIILGGESLKLKDFEFLMLEFGNDTRIINSYGVTEATIDSTYYECEVDTNHDLVTSTPIGIPFPNVQLYVLDDEMRIVPKGVMGELYIGGQGVAKGYLNRPELTKEKFIADPFKKEGLLYKSGDMVKRLPNGALEFYGRQDDQVKIRGYRIELGEIENSLKQISFIEDAIVLIIEDDHGDKKLVAYLISKKELNINELRGHLSEKIPMYMLPESYIMVDEFPLTVNGKLDKRKLLELGGDRVYSVAEYIAPRNKTEETLVEIWADFLKIDADKIGVNSNFIELGGHSLKVIRVLTKIQKELGVKIEIQKFFEVPILENIAEIITNLVHDDLEQDEELESFRI